MPKWYKPQMKEVGSVWLKPSAKMGRQYIRHRRDFRPATERFGIEVLLPGAAIERLGGIS
jgi:hypothetical protein